MSQSISHTTVSTEEKPSLVAGKEEPPPSSNPSAHIVTWDGPDDFDNPKNWSFSLRWRMTAIASAFQFVAPISTSMIAPALSTIAKELLIEDAFEQNMTLSAFVLAYALGALASAPLSEIFGRRYVLQICSLFFLAFNTACGFCDTGVQLIVCRFFAGLGGSAAGALTAGILGDVWRIEGRGLSISLFTAITLLGPTMGPLIGGFVTQYSSWRWTFWTISILSGCVEVVAFFFLRETFEPVLLKRKAERLRREKGDMTLRTKWETPKDSFSRTLLTALARPIILLATQPIFQVVSLYISYLFGLVYLVLATFAALWTDNYHESISIAGINYLSLALGYVVGTHSCARLQDRLYKYLKRTRGNGVDKPEFRLPLLVPGSLLVPIGLLWYGWSAQQHIFWLMPNIGMAIFAVGVKYCTQCLQLYALDVYPTYAASANAGNNVLRSLFGFGLPIVAPYLYASLDYGWDNTVLAAVALVIGIPAPFLLWHFGPALRRRSLYAIDV